jgi:quinol monooxygenase YgiN
MIAVTSELRAKPGCQADLEKRLRELAERVREAESGCSLYLVVRSKHDAQLYLTFARYDDEEALSVHSRARHYTGALPALMDCLEEPPRVALFDEI